MAEWLIEEGIGEHRAITLNGAQIDAARLDWPGELKAGQVADAVLFQRMPGGETGYARFSDGQCAFVDRLPRSASEGSTVRLEVIRASVGEARRCKLARARPTKAPLRCATLLAEDLRAEGHDTRIVRSFPQCDWSELIEVAQTGQIDLGSASLHFSPTPAMTLVDIDGSSPPARLALEAVLPIAAAIRRFDLGGSVGIDFPTLEARSDRRKVDEAIEMALAHWPHARTAMNGFGFVQLVAKLERPSLLHRAQFRRTAFAARQAMRLAEHAQGTGTVLQLRLHPALASQIREDWLRELRRRTGREIVIETDPALAIESPHAQFVSA